MNQHNKSCLAFTVSSNLLNQEFPPTKCRKKGVKHSCNLETIHNHGSVKNGSISNSTYLSTLLPPCSMILGKNTIHPLHMHCLMLPRCKTGKRFRPAQQQEGLTFWYCWWKKSCTCWCSRYQTIRLHVCSLLHHPSTRHIQICINTHLQYIQYMHMIYIWIHIQKTPQSTSSW